MASEHTMNILQNLERTKIATLRYFALNSNDLDKTHGPGKCPVRYILQLLFCRARRHHLLRAHSLRDQ